MTFFRGIKENTVEWVERMLRFPVVGLDISDRSVKYVRPAFKDTVEIEAYGEAEIPEGAITSGEVTEHARLTEALRSLRTKDRRKLNSPYVAVSLPEEKSFLRVIQLPKIKIEEVGNAIRWEIEANVPLPLEELIFDHEIVKPVEDHLDHFDVVITAFPKILITSYVEALKSADFIPVALELESQAIVRAVTPALSDKKTFIVSDIGRTRSSIVLVSGGAIIFTTTVEFGGLSIEQSIKEALHVENSEALRIKKETGLDPRAYDGALPRALEAPLAAFADEFKKVVTYFSHHTTHRHGVEDIIHEILLTGGDANLFGLPTYLASALKIPVRLADPFTCFQSKSFYIPPLVRQEALGFTTAIGLALRELR